MPAAKTTAKKTTKAPAKAAKKTPAKTAAPKKKPGITKPKASAQNKTATFRIHRAERKNGQLRTYTDDFVVSYGEATTVLQCLEKIKGEMDGSLTYRRSCQASICGSCGMTINNRSRLACKTKVKDLVNGIPERNLPGSQVIEIAPQKNQPILKDLAVDIRPFYEKVEKITPYVQEGKETAQKVDKDSFDQVNLVSNCIMCGLCYSDCTALVENPDYLGPSALAKAFRFVADPREGKKKDRLKKLSKKDGVWDCTRCGMCLDACPKGVDPMHAIVKLRTRAMESGVTKNPGARHAMAFKGDIKTFGVLNEPMLVARTVGLTGMVGQTGNVVNMLKKGKMPNPLPFGEVKNLHEVKAIFKELDENPIDVETKAEDSGPGAG